MKIPHRNFIKERFCAACEHGHFPFDDTRMLGVCLALPPQVVLIGMTPTTAIQKPDASNMVPVSRGQFPTITRADTCSRWTLKTEGEA